MTADGWRNTRVLVTGARGFIGAALSRRLVDAGAAVHGTSTLPNTEGASRIRWSQIDLTELHAVRQLLNRVAPDVIFHLAGRVTGSAELASVQPTLMINLVSTVDLLTVAAERKRSRVVLV